MTEQLQQGLTDALKDIDQLRGTVESLQEMASETPDVEAEITRRMAAKLRADADQLEAGSNVTHPASDDPAPAEEQPADPGFPSESEADPPLAETVEEAQRILGEVEAEEYAKPEPDFKRLLTYQRHATQTEAANR